MADLKVLIGDIPVLVLRLPLTLDFTLMGDAPPAVVVGETAPAEAAPKKVRAPRVKKVAVAEEASPVLAPGVRVLAETPRPVDVKSELAKPEGRKKLVKVLTASVQAAAEMDRSEPYVVSAPVPAAPVKRAKAVKPCTALPCAMVQVDRVYHLEDGRPIVITGVYEQIRYVGYKHKGDRKRTGKNQLPYTYIVYDTPPTAAEAAQVKRMVAAGVAAPYVLERAAEDLIVIKDIPDGSECVLGDGTRVVVLDRQAGERGSADMIMVQSVGAGTQRTFAVAAGTRVRMPPVK